MATSPLPSRGATIGQNCYTMPAFSGVPDMFSGVLGKGNKIRSCYTTPAFSETQKLAELLRNPCVLKRPQSKGQNHKWLPDPRLLRGQDWAELLCHPCVLGGSPSTGKISKVATSPLPSRWPKIGRNCYVTPAFAGIPGREDKSRNGYLTPAFSVAQNWAEQLCHPRVLGNPPKRRKNRKQLHHPDLLRAPILGEIATSPLPS